MKKMNSKERRKVNSALVLVLQVSVSMLVPIFVCSWIGWKLSERFNATWIVIVAFILGCVSGFNGVYKLVKGFLKNDQMDEKTQ